MAIRNWSDDKDGISTKNRAKDCRHKRAEIVVYVLYKRSVTKRAVQDSVMPLLGSARHPTSQLSRYPRVGEQRSHARYRLWAANW